MTGPQRSDQPDVRPAGTLRTGVATLTLLLGAALVGLVVGPDDWSVARAVAVAVVGALVLGAVALAVRVETTRLRVDRVRDELQLRSAWGTHRVPLAPPSVLRLEPVSVAGLDRLRLVASSPEGGELRASTPLIGDLDALCDQLRPYVEREPDLVADERTRLVLVGARGHDEEL